MSAIMRVTGAWTTLALDWLAQRQFAASKLKEALLRWQHEEVVPLPVWQQMLQECQHLAANEAAPELEIGACVQPAHVGKLGYLVLASNTLGDAMLAYQRYETLFYGLSLVQLEIGGAQVDIRWPQTQSCPGQLADGVAIAALVTFVRRQLVDSPSPTQVCFCGSSTVAKQKAYEQFFGCPVLFGQSQVSVHFPLSVLQSPMPLRDTKLRALLDQQMQALLRALPGSSSMERHLQQVLLRLMVEGEPTLQRAAEAMNMSPRTLQRRLIKHGLTWQQWLDRSREQLANDYLANVSLSLSDIALLLGFSEQSAFTRAYRRWTGRSPGQYRSRLKIH